MASNNLTCKACEFGPLERRVNSYSICPNCGSANYTSIKAAAEDNREYFNSVYRMKNRDILPTRKRIFEMFNILDSVLHFRKTRSFNDFLQKIRSIIVNAEKSLEVGFGNGSDLLHFIKSGANIYGIDLSEVAVRNFQQNNPAYKARVACSDRCDFPVDVIYSNALLEHLDEPSKFLTNASAMLKSGGRLITRLPLITAVPTNIEYDISFWKPCHRMLYTPKGLTLLLQKHNFRILESSSLQYYGYKVMSLMLRIGYKDIVQVRNPYLKIEELSDYSYSIILLKSFFEKIICSDVAVLATKID